MSLRVALVGHVDHGKSTLIGRLLSDSHQTLQERKNKVSTYCESQGRKFEYAFLLDALEEEQAQGITIDVTEVNWTFENRKYVFVDTPGHREFLKKMIGGASSVDGAIIMVDAIEGLKPSFYRQMKILDILGVQNRIVLINKMDLVSWDQGVWLKWVKEINQLFLNSSVQPILIPVAAWHGANLMQISENMPWYSGPTLAQALKTINEKTSLVEKPSRLFIQDTFKTDLSRFYFGRVESGKIKVGDALKFFPLGQVAHVSSIEVAGESRAEAQALDTVAVTFDEAPYLERGFVGYPSSESLTIAHEVVGDIFWLDSAGLNVGDRLNVKMATQSGFAVIQKIHYELDSDSLKMLPDAKSIQLLGRVTLKFDQAWAFDSFEHCEPSGRFVMAKNGQVLGGGRWIEPAPETAKPKVGRVFWLTGLSGAGKTTVAEAVQNRLREKDDKVFVLDGDQLRKGICRDLGFSEEDRLENIRRAAEIAKMWANEGYTVLASFITPSAKQRQLAKSIIGDVYFSEVYIQASLEICEKRDVKGLYAKARQGVISDFTGIGSAYEIPEAPDLVVNTEEKSISDSAEKLRKFISKK